MHYSIRSEASEELARNCQGDGNVAFQNHAYELHHKHRSQILNIIEPRIPEEWAQVVIDTLPYTHSRRVDLTSFSGDIWMPWNESNDLKVGILTTSEYSIHALVKEPHGAGVRGASASYIS